MTRSPRSALVVCVAAAIAALPSLARGDAPAASASPSSSPPPVRLRYERGPGAERCPDEGELRNQIAARLGYDPIRDEASSTIVAVITKTSRGLEGRVEIRDPAGKTRGRRTLSSTSTDCTELASSLTLAISIAADPLSLGRAPLAPSSAPPAITSSAPAASSSAVPAPPPPPPPSQPPPAPPAPSTSEPAPRVPIRARLMLGGHGAFGAGPSRAWGLDAGVGVRRGNASLTLEGRIDLPGAATAVAGGTVDASILAGTLAPCLHIPRALLVACALGSAGVIQGRGRGVSVPRKQTTTYAAAGARLGVEVPIVGPLSLGVHGDLLANLTRTTLRLDGTEAWSSPPIAGLVRGALLGSF